MLKVDEALIPKNINILIIEDFEMIRELIKDELEGIGFTGPFQEAPSLQLAQKEFNRIKPNFIMLDWTLEDGTGDKFLKAIRQHSQFDNVPILMITANDNIEDLIDTIKMGASDYLIKPWTTDEFIEKMGQAWLKHFPEQRVITGLDLE